VGIEWELSGSWYGIESLLSSSELAITVIFYNIKLSAGKVKNEADDG
jgi:hypothetical protein